MYTQYYGLRAQAFRLTPDPSYFFSSATHKSALDHILYGMQQHAGFVVISGEPGTGKTTLAHILIDGLPQHQIVIGELVSTQLQPDDLLRAIAAAFELDVEGRKTELLARLQGFLTARVRAGKHVLLVIDEAHDLPQASFEELRMLSNLEWESKALLQCILLGHPPLRDMLSRPSMEQFQQRVLAAHHVISLSLDETRSYILHRLQQAGWHGNPGFTAKAIALIHQYTQGVPRRINALCTRLMIYGFINEKQLIDEDATVQVYIEWMQELGQMDLVVPLRQAKQEEINITGITHEHVELGRAVGANTQPVINAPTEHEKLSVEPGTATTKPHTEDAIPLPIQHKKAASPPTPAVQPNHLKTVASEGPADSPLIDFMPPRSNPMIPESHPHLLQQLKTRHAKLLWLLAVLVVLVVLVVLAAVIGVFYYYSNDNNHYPFTANKKAAQSRIQTAAVSQKGDTTVAETPIPPQQAIPSNITKSGPTTPAKQPSNTAQDDRAGNTKQIASAKTKSHRSHLRSVDKSPKPKTAAHTRVTAHQSDHSALHTTVRPSLASVPVKKITPTEDKKETTPIPITIDKLRPFLNRFHDAFVSGNIDELETLLADDAHGKDAQNRGAIVRSYRKMFNATDNRHMLLSHLVWRSDGNAVQCEGQFDVHTKGKAANSQATETGKMSLRIEKRKGQLVITKLNYRYEQ